MPAFDKTGPQGQGPKTGRGMGPCGDGKGRGMCMGRGIGRGMGFGRCCGRGFGRYFGWNTPQTDEEKQKDMESYKKALQEELEDVETELSNIQK